MNRYSHVILVAGLGMFLSTLDSGVINVALPFLRNVFHSTINHIAWTISIYFLVLSTTIVLFGKLSDRFGRVHIFMVGLILFAVGSLLCGLAFSANQLIAYRVIQALGAAAIQATSAAIITTLIDPKRKNAALGMLGLIIGTGPIIGPTFSGLMISFVSWRWIFLVNLPICLVGLWAAKKLNDKEVSYRTTMDWKGMILFVLIIFSFALAITMGGYPGTHITEIALFSGVCVVSLFFFILQESATTSPMIDINLFKIIGFTIPLIGTIAFGLATAIVLVIPPIYLHNISHLNSWQIGLIAFSAPIGIVLMARFSGKAINYFGEKKLMVTGLLLMIVALILLVSIKANTSVLWFIPFLLLYGIGGGIFQAPNISQTLKVVGQHHQGTVGAINRMFHNLGNGIGVAISAFFISTETYKHTDSLYVSIRHTWFFALAVIFTSVVAFVTEWFWIKIGLSCQNQ